MKITIFLHQNSEKEKKMNLGDRLKLLRTNNKKATLSKIRNVYCNRGFILKNARLNSTVVNVPSVKIDINVFIEGFSAYYVKTTPLVTCCRQLTRSSVTEWLSQ